MNYVTNAKVLAVNLALIILIPGCMSNSDESSSSSKQEDCANDPFLPGCLEQTVLEEDCLSEEVFTGSECRKMLRPESLDFGVSNIILEVGSPMQALTPSFLGDAPEIWIVNPQLPDGVSFDKESGVMSGTPTNASLSKTYTIIASNNAGFASKRIQISVLPVPVISILFEDDLILCYIGEACNSSEPYLEGGRPEAWHTSPPLPQGLEIDETGSIFGIPEGVGESYHTILASNEAGASSTVLRIKIIHLPPESIDYGHSSLRLTLGQPVSLMPSLNGSIATNWSVEPQFPAGLSLGPMGQISGSPEIVSSSDIYTIEASNSGGSVQTNLILEVVDIPVWDLDYQELTFHLSIGDIISGILPSWGGGVPTSWEISPPLPPGFFFSNTNGEIYGEAEEVQEWTNHTVWANNSGGGDSTELSFKVISQPPGMLHWESSEVALASNVSTSITVLYSGPEVDTWAIDPALPQGLQLSNGTIHGTPDHRQPWTDFTVWANNSGGSVSAIISLAIHDILADQQFLLNGMGGTSWNGWPSPILPIGEWSFPIAFSEGGYTSDIPVISASHVGKGKMIGYGHESWVHGSGGTEETEFALRAVRWACGPSAIVGLAYGAGFEDFQEDLESDGHSVVNSVTPDNLSGLDCLIDEFWNGHDDDDNEKIVSFLEDGGGLIMGGHAWYWSYSNNDLAHDYPGNKIAKSTGLFVSSAWGYNDVDMSETPHPLSRPRASIEAIMSDRSGNHLLSHDEASIVDSTLSLCTGVVTLDFEDFWSPLRYAVNQSGWTIIEYGTLWEDVGYNMGEDPVADTLLRVESALMLGLPAQDLPAHPSHIEFPGEVPANATRISKLVHVEGNQSGLPSNFGYSSARAHLRESTGMYAAPGEVVTVTVPPRLVDSGAFILVGAHSDNLWGKEQLHRHPEIVRWWYINQTYMEVGNAFGGTIYVAFEAGSQLGDVEVIISNAVESPTYMHGESNISDWLENDRLNPAPWAEIGSDQFILTVPSHEIRELDNPDELMDWWDQALIMEHELYGFLPWPRIERAVFDAQISAGWMHSGYPFMAHDLSAESVVNVSRMSEEGDWGMFHELGHNHQWMPSTLPGTTEASCNFASVYLMEELVGISGHGAISPHQRESRTRSYFDGGANMSDWSVWVALETFLMVKEEWSWTPITAALTSYYDLPPNEVPNTDEDKFNFWVMQLSNSTGYNLAPYHQAWGFPLNQATFDALEGLPVWINDPLRGNFFEYSAIIRDLHAPSISEANSANISWETYDNGTNISLTLFYGTTDGGDQPSSWDSSISIGPTDVGGHSQEISGLSCCGTNYFARIRAENSVGESWFGPVSWTTDYLSD